MRKVIIGIVVLTMVFTLGFSLRPNYALAGNGPVVTGKQKIEKAVASLKKQAVDQLIANSYYHKKMSGIGKDISKNGEKKVIDGVVVDGVTIPKDIAKTPLVKRGKLRVIIQCSGTPLNISLAKEGKNTVEASYSDVASQLSNLKSAQSAVLNKILQAGIQIKVHHNFYISFNGFSADINIKDLKKLKSLVGPNNVFFATLYKPVDANSNKLIGAGSSGVWTDPGVDGSGMYVGVVDTGIDYTHPDLGGHPGISFPTTKVPAGYDFGDLDSDPMDCQGHGTHVSGIIAADGAVKGVAPKAKIIIAKIVSGCEGSAWSDDIAAAFDYMADPNNIDNGPEGTHPPVASVNMSFGADKGFVDPNAPDQKAIENCISAGIPVALAAGNSGYFPSWFNDNAMIGSPAVTSNCMAVAASHNSAVTMFGFTDSSGTKWGYELPGVSIFGWGQDPPLPTKVWSPTDEVPYYFVGDQSPDDLSDPSVLSGKIAVMEKPSSYSDRAFYAKEAENNGAIGVIYYATGDYYLGGNCVYGLPVYLVGSIDIPVVFTRGAAGPALEALSDKVVQFNTFVSVPEGSDLLACGGKPDTMADFSSWGPPPDLSFKPDITAPGVDIWSTIPVAQGEYASWSGTSMASPHIAACMALVKEAHPDWTPAQIKAALMNTSKVLIDPNSDNGKGDLPYSPRVMGAGRVDVYNALHNDVLVVDKNSQQPYVDLGSIENYKTSPVTFTVTLKNNGDEDVTYSINASVQTTSYGLWDSNNHYPNSEPLDGAVISTDPSSTVTVPAGSSVDVTVTIDATHCNQVAGWNLSELPFVEGFVTFTPQGATPDAGGVPAGEVHIPYMGFLGNWNQFTPDYFKTTSPYDTGNTLYSWNWDFNPLMDPPPDEPSSISGGTWPEDPNTWDYLGVTLDGELDRNAIAISPNGDGYQDALEADTVFLRNTENYKIQIEDANGNIIRVIDDVNEVPGLYWLWFDPYNGTPWVWDGTVYNPSTGKFEPVPDGDYQIVLTATAPKQFNKTDFDAPQVIKFPVKVDTKAPEFTNCDLVNNNDGTYTLNWAASDAVSGIWGYAVVIDDDYWDINWVDPTKTSFTTPVLSSGHHTISLFAIDNAGNISECPAVKITYPKEDQIINSSSVTVKYTVSGDVYGTWVSLDYGDFVWNDAYTSYTFDNLGEGYHTIQVEAAKDPDSVYQDVYIRLISDDYVDFRVLTSPDTTPPTLHVYYPGNRQVINSKVFITHGYVSDDVEFDHLVITTDEGQSFTITNDGSFAVQLSFSSDGNHVIHYTAYDAAGNKTEVSRRVTIATEPPVITLTSPSSNPATFETSTLPYSLTVSGKVTVSAGDISVFTIDGDPVALNADGSFTYTTSFDNYGTYYIKLHAAADTGLVTDETLTVTIENVPLSITTTSLPDGIVGTAYSATLAATGGSGTYTWSIASGNLPDGLTLDASTGTISGTPTTAGTYDFTVQVTDGTQTATKDLSIKVNAVLSITTTSLPDGIVGTAYSATLAATGGSGTYTWSIASGNLPDGLTLDASTGTISGTPTTAGTYDFTVQVTDGTQTATKDLSIKVNASTSSFTVHFVGGKFTLVSFPFTVSSQDIPNFAEAYTFDWTNYWTTTTTFEPGKGYWIKVSQDEDVTLTGTPSTSDVTITVTPGKFNLVGNPFDASIDISALNAANGGHIVAIYTFDWTHYWQEWTPNGTQDFTTLQPGKAYWIKLDSGASSTFTFPAP